MATMFRVRKNDGSGGKIVRGRRVATLRSPYARPTSPSTPRISSSEEEEGNPNWLLGFVAPASRVISGAGKLISNVFFPDTPPSSSEDDSSDDDDSSSESADRSNQNAETPEANKFSQNEVQPRVPRTEAKHVIERLLMQETFSRDECNRLVNIIQSRTVEFPAIEEGEYSRLSELPDRIIGSDVTLPGALQSNWRERNSTASYSCLGNCYDSLSPRAASLGGYLPDFRNTAVMEAKKWLEEKKSESYSQLDKSEGTFTSSPSMLPNVTEEEMGSPVLVAKSYMKARPPWASPTLNHIGFQTSSPIGTHVFKEGTPFSFGANSSPSSKVAKRGSLAVDSWNTLEETRRVRFKSAEDIVQPFSLGQMGSYTSVLESKDGENSAEAEKRDVEPAIIHDSNSSQVVGAGDVSTSFSANLAGSSSFSMHGIPGTEAFPSSSAMLASGPSQDVADDPPVTRQPLDPGSSMEQHNGPSKQSADIFNSEPTIEPAENKKPALGSESNGLPGVEDTHKYSVQPDGGQINVSSQPHQFSSLKETDGIDDPRPLSENHSTQKEVNGSRNTVVANGFPLSSSLYAEMNLESSPRSENERESSDGKLTRGIPLEQPCLLSEASVEIPDTDSGASGSLNDSSRHSAELLHSKRESRSTRGPKVRSSPRIEKQVAKKIGKYSRRGRGRGK